MRKNYSLPENQVTDRKVWEKRRQFLRDSLGLSLGAVVAGTPFGASPVQAAENPSHDTLRSALAPAFAKMRRKVITADEKPTPLADVTSYNNFYEFGTGKDDPADHASKLTVHPWTVRIDGEVEKPADYHIEDLIKPHQLEERIYRLRCVEAWSMVIPWVGIPLASVLKRVGPTGNAKYVAFETLVRPSEMPGQKSVFGNIDWPYREGLRIDEAMHPLTLVAVGLYGDVLPGQNGAPLRLVVPWKYGFKSIKSIVRIRLQQTMPETTWNLLQPTEYGFYANVNPQVDHPRWSQKTERRLPSSLFRPNRLDTRLFNGYEEVASLYSGMDLKRLF